MCIQYTILLYGHLGGLGNIAVRQHQANAEHWGMALQLFAGMPAAQLMPDLVSHSVQSSRVRNPSEVELSAEAEEATCTLGTRKGET